MTGRFFRPHDRGSFQRPASQSGTSRPRLLPPRRSFSAPFLCAASHDFGNQPLGLPQTPFFSIRSIPAPLAKRHRAER
jgi:hypothetical protein